MLSSNTCLIFA